MSKKIIGLIVLCTFSFSGVCAYADTSNVSLDTGNEAVSVSVTATEAQKQLLIESLKGADFENIEYYISLFGEYSDEDINQLTAAEILNYINLYGSYTGKDLVTELGLQKVSENMDSYKDITGFEDILYDAEEYYSNNGTQTDQNTTGNVATSTVSDNPNVATSTVGDNSSTGGNLNIDGKIGSILHKNWNSRKLNFKKFSFDPSVIQKFTDFFQKCYSEYLNGTLTPDDILKYIQSNDYSEIEKLIQEAVLNGKGSHGKGKSTNTPGSANRPISNPNADLSGIVDNLLNTGSKTNTETQKDGSTDTSTQDATSNKTSDSSNIILVMIAAIGSVFGIKKTRKLHN